MGSDLGPLWEREGVQKHRRHKKNHLAQIPITALGAIFAATTFIEGITDVLQVLILLATLVWAIVKIANALKEFHGED